MNHSNLNKTSKFIFFILYLSMYISLLLGEDTLGAAKSDYLNHKLNAEYFIDNIFNSLLIYNTYDAAHSPIFLIFQSIFLKYFNNDLYFKIFNLNLNILIIFVFYNTLKILFNGIDKNYLLIFSSVLLVSPTFRSSSVWPDSFLCGLLFFLISVYFFTKFKKKAKDKFKNSILNTFFLAISSYISPNFAIFVVLFFFEFFKYFKISKEIFYIVIINIILSFPALYYIFVLEINFFSTRGRYNDNLEILSLKNLSNKIIIFPTIVFFHFLFLIFTTFKTRQNKNKLKKIIEIIFVILIILISSHYFNYKNIYNNLGGGGFFYKISNIFFKNNLLLFLFSFISILFIKKYIIQDKLKNFFVLLIIFFSFPQGRIYHQYFELILFISFFILFDVQIFKEFFTNKKNLIFTYLSFFIFWLLNFIKTIFIKGIIKIF
jgi:hypothetical protein